MRRIWRRLFGRHTCGEVVALDQEPRHRRIGPNEFVRVFLVEIAPHERTLCHHHAHDYVMYVMGDAQIVSMPRDGEPLTYTYRDGDCEMSPAGLVHVVENPGDVRFRSLLVELLPGLDELQRGEDPKIVAGTGSVRAIAREARISVWSVEFELNARVEVHGPAIFATLWRKQRAANHPGDLPVGLDNLCDLGSLGTEGRILWDRAVIMSGRAIVFQLGRFEVQPIAVRKRRDEPIKSLRTHAEEPE